MTQGTKVAFRHRVHGDCLAGRECVTGPSSRRCLHGTKGGSCCLALERASCLVVKLFSVPALTSCFAFPGECLLQASKRNQKTRPGIRPQPLLDWGALLTGRVCRPTTWRANLPSCMPGTRSVGRITASGHSLYGSGLRYVEVWHARGHPPPEAPLSSIESFRSPPAPHARRYSPARPPTGTTARRRAPSTAGRSATVCSSAGPSRESGCNARSR